MMPRYTFRGRSATAWKSSLRSWFRSPYGILAAFLALTIGPALGLVWLGWRLLDQDRALENQRISERREHAADQLITALQRALQTSEMDLAQLRAPSPAGDALMVEMRPSGWTADNKIGLISTSPSRNAIYIVPLSGGKATQVIPDGSAYNPQWSPDGGKIYLRWGSGAFAYVPSGGASLSVVLRNGERVTVTVPGGGNHISPDGKRLVFSAYKAGGSGNHLWTMPVTGGELVQLPMNPDLNVYNPRWSPDGM